MIHVKWGLDPYSDAPEAWTQNIKHMQGEIRNVLSYLRHIWVNIIVLNLYLLYDIYVEVGILVEFRLNVGNRRK